MLVKDIVNENAQTALVVESPHKTEVKEGIPLAGDSGHRAREGLGISSEDSLGQLASENSVKISLINTFQNPLQISPELREINSDISRLNYKKLGPANYRQGIKDILDSSSQLDTLMNSYSKRISLVTGSREEQPKLIVCGFIAQSFFELFYELDNAQFGNPFEIEDGSIAVFFAEHPSPINEHAPHWTEGTQQNGKLRAFAVGI